MSKQQLGVVIESLGIDRYHVKVTRQSHFGNGFGTSQNPRRRDAGDFTASNGVRLTSMDYVEARESELTLFVLGRFRAGDDQTRHNPPVTKKFALRILEAVDEFNLKVAVRDEPLATACAAFGCQAENVRKLLRALHLA